MPKEMALPSGHVALVDYQDFFDVRDFAWYRSGKLDYVARTDRCSGVKKHVYLHNQLMNHEPNKTTQVDHINGNGLDNRRSNLEVVTVSENNKRMAVRKYSNKDIYGNVLPLGVRFTKNNTWNVTIDHIGRGTFKSFAAAVDAVEALRKL